MNGSRTKKPAEWGRTKSSEETVIGLSIPQQPSQKTGTRGELDT